MIDRVQQILFFGLGLYVLVFAGSAAMDMESQVVAVAMVTSFIPIALYAFWRAFWGIKRDDGTSEHISITEPPPSTVEKVMATSWLVIRRIVCFVGFIVLLVLSTAEFLDSQWLAGFFYLFISLLCLFVGIVGQSSTFAVNLRLKDDLRSYRERKRRYGWRW